MASVMDIKWVAKALRSSPLGRKMFRWGIETVLFMLESERLIDWKQVEKVQIDWEKQTISGDDSFVTSVAGRAISQYGVSHYKNILKGKAQQLGRNKAPRI